jgi:hypothetical protein
VTYDATAHTATGTATGVGGVDLSAGLTLSGTTHTNAGDYPSDAWSFAGGTNYNDASGTVHDIIDKATASITVTPYHVTYDATAHTATGTATGVGGVDLSAGLTLSGTTHTNAGDYPSDAWSFAGGTNYNDASGTVHDIIDKATASITVTPYSVTYDGNAHTATGTATGVGGVSLSGLDLSGTTHTNVGDYPSDAWSFSNANYNGASGTVHDSILDAAPVVHAGGNVTLDPGDLWTRNGKSFTDSDSTSWTGKVDYGDGTGNQDLTLYNVVADVGGSFDLSHTWTAPGTYTVTVSITDNGGVLGTGTFMVTVNTPQLLIGGAAISNVTTTALSQRQLQQIIPAAIDAWRAAGVNAAGLNRISHTPIQIVPLMSGMVGGTNPAGIQIDPTAAGHGWSVDSTRSPAPGRVDLLTVVEHEMGNVLGFPETNGHDVMSKWLATGERRLPTSKPSTVTVSGLGSSSSSPTGSLLGALTNLVPDDLAVDLAQLSLNKAGKPRRS